jgi:hypothetical protein
VGVVRYVGHGKEKKRSRLLKEEDNLLKKQTSEIFVKFRSVLFFFNENNVCCEIASNERGLVSTLFQKMPHQKETSSHKRMSVTCAFVLQQTRISSLIVCIYSTTDILSQMKKTKTSLCRSLCYCLDFHSLRCPLWWWKCFV